jgi:glycerol-3-phosphate acyltransferase PlsY
MLTPPKIVLLTPITIVIVVVVVIVASIITVVVMTPIIVPVIGTAIWLVEVGSPANILLDLLVGLISICTLLRHREKVLNRVRPLAKKFGPESIMVVETSDKCGDSFVAVNVRDGYPCF